ncbi:MAG: hypothetical protein ACETVQ_04585 [Candidatus Bathyarchaeia archaeon]
MFEENTLTTEEEALRFINKYGFVTLFPIRGFSFPNLYQSTAGKDKEEKFEKAWQWADNLSEKKKIHYGKLVRKQVTLISLDMFPYFYKLYGKRKLSQTAQKILGFLEQREATSTTLLKKNLDLMGKAKKYEFMKAMDELQVTFSVAIVGREKSPRMTYSYDLIERWMPTEPLKRAEDINGNAAKERIRAKLLENKVFSKHEDAETFLKKL